MVGRQHAQVVTLDLQRTVEARAEILQRDRGRQFYYLRGSEEAAQFRKYCIADLRWCPGHALGIAQHRLFARREMAAGFERSDILQLLVADAHGSATGRVDIHSEGTTDHLRSPHRHQ